MRYDNPQLADMLALEYVLGTLKKPVRARYEQLLRQRPDWQAAHNWWQAHIHLLADTVPATNPPNQVWQNIEQRLFTKNAFNQTKTPNQCIRSNMSIGKIVINHNASNKCIKPMY